VELLNLNLEREVSTGEISLDGGVIQLSNAAMNVPSNVLDLPKEFSISALGKRDMMPLHSGIVNVTGEHSGFRFLPDGKHFSDKIQIEIPYDDSKFPSGMGLKDVQCFYFDLESRQWRTVPVGEVDTDRKVLIAKTDHFTDYINGIISVPESPSTTEYTPTVMSDIKVADPSAGVNVMRPPSANNSGDATLSYPIVIPPGRKGFQPSVSLNYSSSAGSGWLGYGWSISTPSITVDTRWGAPKFDAQYETELYSLNGEQLLLQPCNNAQDLYRPHRHEEGSASCNFDLLERNGPNAPCTDDTAIFYERRMGSFSKIERIGSTPTEYVWEVTSSDGTRHFYGNPSDDSFEIGSGLGIAKWMLWKVIDKYGNTIVYDYDAIEDELGTKTKLYLKNINYTGHTTGTGNNEQYVPGEFDIQFNLQTNPSATYERKDISINNRSGFKEIDDKLLESIKVVSSISSSVVFVREYVLSYDEGAFSKTRLIELKELDRNGIEFYAHKFDYHNDLGSDPCNLFEPPVLVPIVCDETYPVDCGTIDSDFDGIYDLCDDCPDVFDPSNVCDTPYPCGMNDEDGDGIFDDCDNCPEHYNVGQQDSDNDGVGNACDNCHHYNPDQLNSDGDNFADACDNCPQVINNIQVDSDLDGWGNDCDFCPTIADPFQLDIDGDELGVSCDNCQFTYNPGQADLDGDGIGYACDYVQPLNHKIIKSISIQSVRLTG